MSVPIQPDIPEEPFVPQDSPPPIVPPDHPDAPDAERPPTIDPEPTGAPMGDPIDPTPVRTAPRS